MKPNSHVNIKMTLVPGQFPTHFEGEIQCSIDWESDTNKADEARSVHTNTNVPDVQEYLFLRLKKRSKFVSGSANCLADQVDAGRRSAAR